MLYRLRVTCLHVGMQVLANGEEVKLQRNALSVLEYGPDEQQVCGAFLYTSAGTFACPQWHRANRLVVAMLLVGLPNSPSAPATSSYIHSWQSASCTTPRA